ncbi:MAG: DNA-formamidopyrimidine glycosylase [Candidatus Omnitrophica bacterium 4484_213]|nr:MAG: DNA-formamidopyrimidine glycosylase [Candidatus Omnitrophica bacterium 4484_213]
MPELPEIETIKRDLEDIVIGKRIKDVEVKVARVIKEPRVEDFIKGVQGKEIREILRRGKVLILRLSAQYLVIHLRMTGQIVYSDKQEKSKVAFLLSDGKYLNFLDQRVMGEIRLLKDWQELPFIKQMGLEPLDKEFTLRRFQEILKGKKTKIKPLLMEQGFIAGIGNLYAAEILFRAKVSPLRSADSLTLIEIEKVYLAIKEVLQEGIRYRGSSVDTYRDAHGEKGNFGKRIKVYGREGKPCFECGNPIKKITLGGRGTYFCPICQK